MNTHARKSEENLSKTFVNHSNRKSGSNNSIFQLIDKRSGAIAKRKLQKMASDSLYAMQMKAFQNRANKSLHERQVAQFQVNRYAKSMDLNITSTRVKPFPVIGAVQRKAEPGKMNIVGEEHYEQTIPDKAANIRVDEREFTKEKLKGNYWTEADPFIISEGRQFYGDDPVLRATEALNAAQDVLSRLLKGYLAERNKLNFWTTELLAETQRIDEPTKRELNRIAKLLIRIFIQTDLYFKSKTTAIEPIKSVNRKKKPSGCPYFLSEQIKQVEPGIIKWLEKRYSIQKNPDISKERSRNMLMSAVYAKNGGLKGVWKVGNDHVKDMKRKDFGVKSLTETLDGVTLTSKEEFALQVENYIKAFE